MVLPTFLGIGVPRAGTTWLYNLLASHPDVYVPARRKEIHYFDQHYDQGLEWYGKFFPSASRVTQYRALGEITPHYLYCDHCPERIARMISIKALILLLRDPVDRAHSHYGHRVRLDNFSGSFESFLMEYPEALDWGYYARNLKSYLRHFDREQMLILIYERALTDIVATKGKVAGALDIEVQRFPSPAGSRVVNRSYVPRFRAVHALAVSVVRQLRGFDLDWPVNLAKRFRIDRLFGEQQPLPPMNMGTRKHLRDLYADEVCELEALLQVDLGHWK